MAASACNPARTLGRLMPIREASVRSAGRRPPGYNSPRSIISRTWATTCSAVALSPAFVGLAISNPEYDMQRRGVVN
jgi:hypothetical protein